MAILDEVLAEEYERMQGIKRAMERELDELPKGYISKKNIHGRPYFYLQKRADGRVVSSFIPEKELESLRKQIERRKQLQASLRELGAEMKKIKRVMR